jgi:hypothetical protein
MTCCGDRKGRGIVAPTTLFKCNKCGNQEIVERFKFSEREYEIVKEMNELNHRGVI